MYNVGPLSYNMNVFQHYKRILSTEFTVFDDEYISNVRLATESPKNPNLVLIVKIFS